MAPHSVLLPPRLDATMPASIAGQQPHERQKNEGLDCPYIYVFPRYAAGHSKPGQENSRWRAACRSRGNGRPARHQNQYVATETRRTLGSEPKFRPQSVWSPLRMRRNLNLPFSYTPSSTRRNWRRLPAAAGLKSTRQW